MKLSNVQIALIEAALNYDERENQLSDNMSNLTALDAEKILKAHGIKIKDQETFYKQIAKDEFPELKGLFFNEDIDERMDIIFDCENELNLKGRGFKVFYSDANRKKTYGHQLLWMTNEAINAYFDHIEPEPKSEIDLIDEEIKRLEEKKSKLLKIKELEMEIKALKQEL